MRTGVVLLVVVGAAALSTRAARAGCQNACTATADPIAVTPPLDCAIFQSLPQTCDCALQVTVQNGCAGALTATGFVWSNCQTASGTGMLSCAAVQPGGRGSLSLNVSTLGRTPWSLTLQTDDGSHTVDAALQVSSFDHGGCAIAGTPQSPACSLMTTLLVGAALGGAARRRPGSRRRLTSRRAPVRPAS